jgi:MinD-like ATPase involved in chromosome partitioning or flagellar assembly
MSRYPDETGAWWTEFPGNGGATWVPAAPPSSGPPAPAQDGVRGALSRRALRHGLIVPPGRRERARREAIAQWRHQRIAAIREPSLKSGVITVGSGFGGTGKTDVAVTLAAIYAAARPADRVIFADSNDDMPHGYIRLGGLPVEALPQHQWTMSIRGFHQACTEGRIKVYADLRDAVAWLQGVAVIRGDTAEESAGVDFGEQEYLAVLEFLQCMSNIVINDGGTGLFAKLQVGTLLHGDQYVFVTEASQLGSWSIRQVFSRYRNYEGEKDRPLTEQEIRHLNRLMDEATVVVDKFVETDPEQARWHTQIRESFEGTQVSVIATPWDRALANRVPLDLGAVAGATLDAKLAMAEQVLRGVDRADRRRRGLPEREAEDPGLPGRETEDPGLPGRETEDPGLPGRETEDPGLPGRETEDPGSNPWSGAWPPRRPSPPPAAAGGPGNEATEPDTADIPVIAARPEPTRAEDPPDGPDAEPDPPHVRINPARPEPDRAEDPPDGPDAEPGPPRAWILPTQPEPGSPGEPGTPG